jgi:hypothetical protein
MKQTLLVKLAPDQQDHVALLHTLEMFIAYKAALARIPMVYVNPAYTSQTSASVGIAKRPAGNL